MSDQNLIRLRGVLFRCTIRGGHASLAIIVTSSHGGSGRTSSDDSPAEERMVLVIVRLGGPEWDAKLKNTSASEQDRDDEMTTLRSNVRRLCKLGNEMEFHGQYAESGMTSNDISGADNNKQTPSNDWHTWDRFIVDYYLPDSQCTQSNLRVCEVLKWSSTQCQCVRARYFPSSPKKQQPKRKVKQSIKSEGSAGNGGIAASDSTTQPSSRHHGGGLGKRMQGEIVADFLLWMLSTMGGGERETQREQSAQNSDVLQSSGDSSRVEEDGFTHRKGQYLFEERWVPLDASLALPENQSLVAARNQIMAQMLTQPKAKDGEEICEKGDTTSTLHGFSKGGIIDAAGGAGHVSLALALRGVHSTVVDPRTTVGQLPGRDRKALKKSKKPPFSTYRAWFGSRPKGVDSFFREGNNAAAATDRTNSGASFALMDGSTVNDPTTLPICSYCSEDRLIPGCTAIVALHPDEATGCIVELAVQHEKPFLVVPCCVFSRLFPERIKPSVSESESSAVVSTYYDLIDWLVAKHPSIKVTRLPFDGANLAVWATFK